VIPLSILDLMMIGEGKTFADTLSDAVMLARHAEQHGYNRYWIAEHHNLPGIASSATGLIVQHLAQATRTIRVGAGGIMLPNHSPLVVAENFATLETLFPGRIDLGLGRAPGSAGPALRALRGRAPERDFAEDIGILSDYLLDNGRQPVRGIPGRHDIPFWILGSSTSSARLAAHLGLPYAFASHFAPHELIPATRLYRETFQPSAALQAPYVMVGVNAFAADTSAEAMLLASSHYQWVNQLHRGQPGPLPLPKEAYLDRLSEAELHGLGQAMAYSAVGNVDEVGLWLRRFIEATGADELIIDARIHDPVARCRSYELVARSLRS
jgi:luciferase family oxidoreductase group 1